MLRTYLINGRQGSPSHILSELGVMENNYLFAGRLALVSTCITASSPRDAESRSCCGQDLGGGRQSELKRRSLSVVRRGPQSAAVRFNNGTADG